MINKYIRADDETAITAARKASKKYKNTLDRLSEYDTNYSNDRCINCGHYYSPDELTEVEYYDASKPKEKVSICYYCSTDIEKENKESELN